jgi:hypothetical protein
LKLGWKKSPTSSPGKETDDPTNIGNILLARRAATPDDLAAASEAQKEHGRHLGTQLLNLFRISPKDLIANLLFQDKLRGTKPDVLAYARSVANATSLHHFRLQQKHKEVQDMAEAIAHTGHLGGG